MKCFRWGRPRERAESRDCLNRTDVFEGNIMSWSQWIFIGCVGAWAVEAIYILRQAAAGLCAPDYTIAKGTVGPAVFYSLTGALAPWKKESAKRNLISYGVGITFHTGIFTSFLWLAVRLARVNMPGLMIKGAGIFLAVTTLCGLVLLFKRLSNEVMRKLSYSDDYFSNIMVTILLALAAGDMWNQELESVLFVYAGLVFLYMPLGKLRHAIYFCLTRIYLGLFYGRRGVWPTGRRTLWQK